MRKIKYFLFLIPFLFTLNVYATNYNLSSKIKYNVSLPGGSYGADDLNDGYNTVMGRYNVGTRYNGRVGYMEFFVSGDDFNATINHTYTITLNMATNDWRNNFMGPIVYKCNSDGSEQSTNSHLVVSNFRFISRKQIKFNFKTNSSLSPYYKFIIYSYNYASQGGTAITGETNWNLSSIIISDNTSSGGGSSGSTPTPTPTPSASNKDIINNANQNTDDIINNNNQNTDDIINNNNDNTQSIINSNKESLQTCYYNYFNVYNVGYYKGVYSIVERVGDSILVTSTDNVHSDAPSNKTLLSLAPGLQVGHTYKLSFDNNSSFNYIYLLGSNYIWWNNTERTLTQSDLDSIVVFYTLKNNHRYYYNFMIQDVSGNVSTSFVPYGEKCYAKLDAIGQSVVNGAQSIIDSFNSGNQQTNDNLNDIKDSLTDETTPEIDLDLNLDTSSPVSDLLTMPLTILNKVFNITDDTCQPYVLPFDFSGGNNTLTLPCIDLRDFLGNSVYNVLDTILCFYLCYQIGMMCISIYEDITSLRDGFDGLYTPKHHDTSTRVGRGELEGKY